MKICPQLTRNKKLCPSSGTYKFQKARLYYLDGVNRKREVGPGSATSSFFFSTPLAMTKGDGEARQLPASCLDPAAVAAAALSQSSGA